MRKEIQRDTTPRYEEIRCNRCGKSIRLCQGLPMEDFVSVDKVWGYASEQDGVRMQFDLCESCVRELIEGFELPPTMEEVSELI